MYGFNSFNLSLSLLDDRRPEKNGKNTHVPTPASLVISWYAFDKMTLLFFSYNHSSWNYILFSSQQIICHQNKAYLYHARYLIVCDVVLENRSEHKNPPYMPWRVALAIARYLAYMSKNAAKFLTIFFIFNYTIFFNLLL